VSSILSLLGAGGPGGPGPGPAGPGPGPAPSTKGDGDWEEDLHNALAALRELAGDAQDAVERNAIDKCISALSSLQANRQRGAESALGVTPAHKSMSRAY
jgi:hypothetical protein